MFREARTIITLMAIAVCAQSCAGLAPRQRADGPAMTDDGVRFRYYAPNATRVQIAGNWPQNNWARGDGSVGEADIGLMSDKDGDGVWEITVPLPPGRYYYVFWLDENTYQLDPGNQEQVTAGPAGTASQIVVISVDGEVNLR